ncbi:NTPase [archaeon]|nr:NTPase [archaeon]
MRSGNRGLRNLIFLTGRPGVGKTTVVMHIVDELKKRGYQVGGMVSSEVRFGGFRVAFKIKDLMTGDTGTLADATRTSGPRIGRYRVNLDDLNNVGVRAIQRAVENADVVVVDEVGPMELTSERFVRAVEDAIRSGKVVLGTLHYRARHPLILQIKRHPRAVVLEVTLENRDTLPQRILNMILPAIERSRSALNT